VLPAQAGSTFSLYSGRKEQKSSAIGALSFMPRNQSILVSARFAKSAFALALIYLGATAIAF
jgi:hypothetical protein